MNLESFDFVLCHNKISERMTPTYMRLIGMTSVFNITIIIVIIIIIIIIII